MRLHVYDVALRVPFRGLSRRSGILFRGPAGWAEWSPFPEYGDEEAAAWLRAALEAAELGHPGAVRDSIEVNGIVPALAPGEAAARAVASGCRSIKIKVAERGQGLDDDVAEDLLGDASAFTGVSRYPARIKCALLGWAALRDALVRTDTLGRDASATIAATASAPHTTISNPAPDSQEIS